jgi:hypothetical protein
LPMAEDGGKWRSFFYLACSEPETTDYLGNTDSWLNVDPTLAAEH